MTTRHPRKIHYDLSAKSSRLSSFPNAVRDATEVRLFYYAYWDSEEVAINKIATSMSSVCVPR